MTYTQKIISKLNLLVAAMDSITLILTTLEPCRRLKIRSLKMKHLINLKDTSPATHLSPMLPPIKNVLPDVKWKEQIMHDYYREV